MFFAEGQSKGARYLEVERRKAGETSDVPRSNVFAELVFHGIGKSGMNLVNRDQCQFPRRRQGAPEQETVRRVKREPTPRVRLDHRLREVAKELIEVVEVAKGPGPNIRSVQHVASYLIASRHLEFAVGIAAAIGKFEDSRCP